MIPGEPENEVVERAAGVAGELVLRRAGADFQIIADGTFLMDTSDGRSERLLVRAALDAAPPGSAILIGGLGVGFSLAAAAVDPRPARIDVVEREEVIVRWYRDYLGPASSASADPRVRIIVADLLDQLELRGQPYGAICLDIDNGPGWTVDEPNRRLYTAAGIQACARRLRADGVLTVWSAQQEPEYEGRLRRHFAAVERMEVPVGRGSPDIVFVARGPRVQ